MSNNRKPMPLTLQEVELALYRDSQDPTSNVRLNRLLCMKLTFEELIDRVDEELREVLKKDNKPVVVTTRPRPKIEKRTKPKKPGPPPASLLNLIKL
jgi:hypothetical protein